MPYTRPYGSGGFKDTPDTSTPITAAALNTIDVGVANAHSDIASTLATIPSRNRIINGAMMVDQRSAGASASVTDGDFGADRFIVFRSAATLTRQRVSNDGPAGVSPYSLKITNGTGVATPLASGAYHGITQKIEGYNVADFGFGTASPQPIVLSFYVKSSVTGTYSVSLRNNSVNRSYVSTYTVSAANTWERKSVSLTADASGTWSVDNTGCLLVDFSLGHGSTNSTSTLNAWQAGNYNAATTAGVWVATTGATFQLSGVQLEYGTAATRFEHRSYQEELARCQRYYERKTYVSGNTIISVGQAWTTTTAGFQVPLLVEKRAAPNLSCTSGNSFSGWSASGASASAGAITQGTTANSPSALNLLFTASSVIFTVGQAAGIYVATPTVFVAADAEL